MIPEVKLAYYQKKDWEKFISSIADKDTMHDNWEDWHRDFSQAKTRLMNMGLVVHDITIDIDELKKYCVERRLMNNGKTRSEYAAQLPIIGKKRK